MRNYLDKKGDVNLGLVSIVSIVLAIATLVVLILLSKNYGDTATGATDIEACRISVLKAGASILGQNPLGNELKCPVNKVNILDKGDDKVENENNYFARDQDDVKEIIAKEMYDCWYKFGSGEVDFVKKKDTFEKNHCYVCSQINFGDNLLKNTKITNNVEGFDKFLVATNIPGTQTNYYEHFTKQSKAQATSQMPLDLKIDKPVAVVYSITAQNIVGERLKALNIGLYGGTAVGLGLFIAGTPPGWVLGGTAAIAGSAFYLVGGGGELILEGQPAKAAVMAVVPLEELKTQCDYRYI